MAVPFATNRACTALRLSRSPGDDAQVVFMLSHFAYAPLPRMAEH